MTFVLMYSFPPERRESVVARFKETGGLPPAGVKLLSRWHAIGGGKGFLIAESTDTAAMAKWVQNWADITSFEICPVMNDDVLAQVI